MKNTNINNSKLLHLTFIRISKLLFLKYKGEKEEIMRKDKKRINGLYCVGMSLNDVIPNTTRINKKKG